MQSDHTVAAVLEEYAKRGLFRGFSAAPLRAGKAAWKLVWHRDRAFDLVFDPGRNTLHFPIVLPEASPAMHAHFREFVDEHFASDLPDHRRIDREKVSFETTTRKGNISLTAKVLDGDYEYAARKLVNLVHETYLVFLNDGRYYNYLVQTFDLDPDHM